MQFSTSKNGNTTPEALCVAKAKALCHAQPSDGRLRAALCFELPQDGSIPEWVELIPAGPNVVGRDGRAWVNDRPEQVVKELKSHGRDLVLDWEHSTELKAPKGEQAPAAGWFTDFQAREGGAIFARLNLNERGRNSIQAREYRYLSPVLLYEPATRRIADIASVGLSNKPNLHLSALNHQLSTTETMEHKTMLEELLKLLGLPAGTTLEAALNFVRELRGKVSSLDTQLQAALNSAQSPSLEKFVPRADYNAVLERAINAETKLAAAQKAELDKEIDTEVDAAVKAGKITPATVEYHKANCRQEGGLARFREFVKAAPVIAGDTGLDNKDPNQGGGKAKALNAEQKKVCKQMGLTEEEYLKSLEAE